MKKMTLLFAATMNFFSSLAVADSESSAWADLGLIEKTQVIEAANYCDTQNGATLSVMYTDVALDGSVGYQGVYNYIYTTEFILLDKNGQELSHVRVISEHSANIDTTPISYAFRVVSASANGVACEIP